MRVFSHSAVVPLCVRGAYKLNRVRYKTLIFHLLGWGIVNLAYSVGSGCYASLLLTFLFILFDMHWCGQFTTYKGNKMLSVKILAFAEISSFCVCYPWVYSDPIVNIQQKRKISILRCIPSAHIFVRFLCILISASKVKSLIGSILNTFSNSVFFSIFNVSVQMTWDQK